MKLQNPDKSLWVPDNGNPFLLHKFNSLANICIRPPLYYCTGCIQIHVSKNAKCFEVIWKSTTININISSRNELVPWRDVFPQDSCFAPFVRDLSHSLQTTMFQEQIIFSNPTKINWQSMIMSRWFPSCLFFCGYQTPMLVDPQRELVSHCLKLFW